MIINLYTTANDPRDATKSLDTIASNILCKPAEPCTMIEPRVILNYSAAYAPTNYIYISDFDGYYFAEKTLLTGGELLLTCKLDPLMTFELSDIEAMIIRSESAGVNYIPDSKLPVDPSRCTLDGKLFPLQPFVPATSSEGLQYLLTINGGATL